MTEYEYKEGQRIQFNATIAYWDAHPDEDRNWFPVTLKDIRQHALTEYILEGEIHTFETRSTGRSVRESSSDIFYLDEVPKSLRLPRRTEHSCYVPNKYFTPVSAKKDRFESVLEGVL